MDELVIVNFNGENRIDSRLIAKSLGIEHKTFLDTVRKYQDDFQELGVLPFSAVEPPKINGGRGRPESFAMLNENQSIFAGTLSRNTKQVIAFKLNLTKAFSEARQRIAPIRHHINQDYYQRLKINREGKRFNPSRFTTIEVLDNLSLKWGYDLFELTEKCRPDISYGKAFMDALRKDGYNTTIGKSDSEIIKVWHVVDIRTMLEKEVNSFPNKWYGFNLDFFGTVYVSNYLPKYLRGNDSDGNPRAANAEELIEDLQKKIAYTYQPRLF